MKKVQLVLHNIRSAHNIGSIFRTADAVGVSKIFLTGYSPRPIDKFGKPQKEIAKTALGAEIDIPWEYEKNVSKIIKKLKAEKTQIIAIEQSKNSSDYKKIKPKFPVAFILGNEVKGISKQLLGSCDVIAEIPMVGNKESLNVSVSAGVALFRILNI
ncbi:MAG: TrmH family RNA methyltransferase [Candidatus Paceibacterota bacterium]